jgi:hypothetical protein
MHQHFTRQNSHHLRYDPMLCDSVPFVVWLPGGWYRPHVDVRPSTAAVDVVAIMLTSARVLMQRVTPSNPMPLCRTTPADRSRAIRRCIVCSQGRGVLSPHLLHSLQRWMV